MSMTDLLWKVSIAKEGPSCGCFCAKCGEWVWWGGERYRLYLPLRWDFKSFPLCIPCGEMMLETCQALPSEPVTVE